MNDEMSDLLRVLGMEMVEASAERVVLSWQVGRQHLQPMGLVHGGIHCTAIETVCSVGAWLAVHAVDPGKAVVGLENHTSFVRATREGRLRAIGTPITRGRTTHVWEATVRDAQERIVATGRVRLLVVDARSP